jgi:hypothetical protein
MGTTAKLFASRPATSAEVKRAETLLSRDGMVSVDDRAGHAVPWRFGVGTVNVADALQRVWEATRSEPQGTTLGKTWEKPAVEHWSTPDTAGHFEPRARNHRPLSE